MLKFTKNGKIASTGSLPINSQKKDKPHVVLLTSFKEVSAKVPAGGVSQLETSNVVGRDKRKKPIITFNFGPNTHLQRSKVSREELLKLDSKFNELTNKMPEVAVSTEYCNNKFDSVDGDKMRKESVKCTLCSLRSSTVRMRRLVSVYNDGYFPKIQPLSKFFTLNPPDSELLSKETARCQCFDSSHG